MKKYLENESEAVRYLFGELADAERDRFEERLFADEDFSVFLDNTENDLIDEYLRGELNFEDKRKFEIVYLKNKNRSAKVEAARVLHKNVFNEQQKTVVSKVDNYSFLQSLRDFFRLPNLALAGGLAAVLLVILLGGIWFLNNRQSAPMLAGVDNFNQTVNALNSNDRIENPAPVITNESINKTENTVQPNTNRRQQNQPPKLENIKPKTTEKPKNAEPPQRVFAFSLLPPLRSGKNPVLVIPSSAKTVRLALFDNFGQKYEKYSVELNDNGGATIWSQEVKTAKSPKSITVNIPDSLFKEGNHEIAVSGVTKEGSVEEISFYNFAVRRK